VGFVFIILLTILFLLFLFSQAVEAVQHMMRAEKAWINSEVQMTLTQHERAGTLAGPPIIPQLPSQYHAPTNPPNDDGEWEQIYNFTTSLFVLVHPTTGRIRKTPLLPAKKKRRKVTPPSPSWPRPNAIVSSGASNFVMTP
jgi:hypothetical protein